MPKLPALSAREIINILTKHGFKIVGRKGSHIRLKKKNKGTSIVIVPDHKELAPGTLMSIIRQSKLPKEEFIKQRRR